MKFIIENTSSCSDMEALEMVMAVVNMGLISGSLAAAGLQYCYHTSFKNGLHVSVFKRKSGTQKFMVHTNGKAKQ